MTTLAPLGTSKVASYAYPATETRLQSPQSIRGPQAKPFSSESAAAGPPRSPQGGKSGAAAGAQLLRVASFNVENFFDTVDVPAPVNDTVVSQKDYQLKLDKLSLAIRDVLKGPQIITIQEVENEDVLKDLAAHPNIKALGYKVASMPTNDLRNINLAVMYRPDAVSISKISQYSPDTPVDLGDNPRGQVDMDKLYARPPLVVDFEVLDPTGNSGAEGAREGARALTVIVNHFKSKLGGEKPEARRQLQGESLGQYVDQVRKDRPGVPVLATGDFNALFEDGAYKKLVSRPDGSRRFQDTTMTVPEEDRYTYIYKGKPNMLDHMLVTDDLMAAHAGTTIEHFNSGKSDHAQASNPKVPNGVSDHDVIVATFNVGQLPALRAH